MSRPHETDHREADRVVAHLHAAQHVAGLGSWEGLGPGQPLYWSPTAYEIVGWSQDRHPTFSQFVELVHPDDRQAFLDMRDDAIAGRAPYAIDLRIIRPDGDIRHVHLAAWIERDASGRPTRLIGTVQDRTDEVDTERRIAQLEDARRQLLHRVLLIEHEERRQLTHTVTTRPSIALGRIIQVLDDRIGTGALPAGTRAAGDHLRQARLALDALRRSLDRDGSDERSLRDALTQLAASTVPDVHVDLEVQVEPSQALGATVVGITREALRNVHKHSGARHVVVHVHRQDDQLRLRCHDDGRGFDPSVDPAPGHLGLTAIRERAASAGGSLTVTSGEHGTTIEAAFPFSTAEGDDPGPRPRGTSSTR